MQNLTIKINTKAVLGFAIAVAVGALLFKSPAIHAQSSTSLSGTFACLTNKNASGYTLARTGQDNQGVNQLFIVNFSGSTGTTTVFVNNTVDNYEESNAVTNSNIASNFAFDVVSVPQSQYMYKLVQANDTAKPIYVAVTNSGNTLLIMTAPASVASANLNGVCQKV